MVRFSKKLPLTVRRQHNIENYIVDFYIAEVKLVIEVDGVQHHQPDHKEKDLKRDAELSKWGITVLRYFNMSIRDNFGDVTEEIAQKIHRLSSGEKPG